MAKSVRLTLETRETVLEACVDIVERTGGALESCDWSALTPWLGVLRRRYRTSADEACAYMQRRLFERHAAEPGAPPALPAGSTMARRRAGSWDALAAPDEALPASDGCVGCGQPLGDDLEARRSGWHYECGIEADAEDAYQRALIAAEERGVDEALDAARDSARAESDE